MKGDEEENKLYDNRKYCGVWKRGELDRLSSWHGVVMKDDGGNGQTVR
jgi:hypothetical protein